MSEIHQQQQAIDDMIANRYDDATIISVLTARADEVVRRAITEQWFGEETQRRRRSKVRALEHKVFQTPAPEPKPSRAEMRARRRARDAEIEAEVAPRRIRLEAGARLLDGLLPLLDKKLPYGNGVLWGEANRNQIHESRERASKQAGGIANTISNMDQALGILIDTGVEVLNDLMREAAA